MIKEKLKRVLIRIFYILFALIVSIVLWLYVEITENEIQEREISNIEVILKNEDVLHDRELLVSSFVTENLSLTFEGTRSDITALAAPGAVTVEVDLINIRSAGLTTLTYEVMLPNSVNDSTVRIIGRSASRISLVIDRLLSKQLSVRVNYTGGTETDDMIAEPAEYDPEFITVRGPEELVSQIDHVFVPILRENLSSTYIDDLEFILIDEIGVELDPELHYSESLVFSHETIRVTVPIRIKKIVHLSVELSHGMTTSPSNTRVQITPESITVSGDPDAVRDLNSITIGTIDMMSFAGLSEPRAFPILLPNNLTPLSGETEASVIVEVMGLETGVRSVSNLQAINIPAGYDAEIITQSVDIRIRGTLSDIARVSASDIWVIADLSEVTNTGTMPINARVNIYGIDVNIDPIGNTRVFVTVREEEEGEIIP